MFLLEICALGGFANCTFFQLVAESCFRIRYVCHVYVSVLAWLLSPAVLFSES